MFTNTGKKSRDITAPARHTAALLITNILILSLLLGCMPCFAASSIDGVPKYVPGTYTAVGKGISSDVLVTVTLDEYSITMISIDVSGETPGIGAASGSKLLMQFLSAQSADIDGVAGATITSMAAKAAVADILSQAKAYIKPVFVPGSYAASGKGITSDVIVAVTCSEYKITEVLLDVSGETPGIGAAAGDALSAQILKTQSAEIDGVTGATFTSNAVRAALGNILAQAALPVQEEAGAFIPGIYTASGKGISSDVVVTITFDGNGMTDVAVDASGETPGIGAAAGEPLAFQILVAQSADIDGVAGATITSKAAKEAVAEIMAQAKN